MTNIMNETDAEVECKKKKKDGGETEIVATGIVRLCVLILISMCVSTEK